jgi:hypothetical protein
LPRMLPRPLTDYGASNQLLRKIIFHRGRSGRCPRSCGTLSRKLQ